MTKEKQKQPRWYQLDASETALVIGSMLITYGAWEIYQPLAPIVSGTILAALALRGMISGDS